MVNRLSWTVSGPGSWAGLSRAPRGTLQRALRREVTLADQGRPSITSGALTRGRRNRGLGSGRGSVAVEAGVAVMYFQDGGGP